MSLETQNNFIERIETEKGVRFKALPGVRNLCLEISYRGEGFMGYQSQPHGVTVQDTLSKAWQILTQETSTLYGCSRLDAGVHANQFFVNLYTRCSRPMEDISRALNGILRTHLNVAISIYQIREVGADFNARFDTLGKHYRYRVWYGRGHHAQLTPASWAVRSREFNAALLSEVLQDVVGEHDFSAFRAADCTAKSTVRKIERIDVWAHPLVPEAMVLDVWGEGFLKNMVRNIAGTAVDIAVGKLCRETMSAALEHGIRSKIGQCAPAHALTLQRVFYAQEQWQAALTETSHRSL
ncbi:tRNA pseudouridine(38-40) synthase TruA [bacterium]|nr:tRNA pseudouridine(38-40) synthase TruA [bacterium]